MTLGRALLLVATLGLVLPLCGCPVAVEEVASDNLVCRPEGYAEEVLRGRIRTSFDFEGGVCRCDCPGTSIDLLCVVTATAS